MAQREKVLNKLRQARKRTAVQSQALSGNARSATKAVPTAAGLYPEQFNDQILIPSKGMPASPTAFDAILYDSQRQSKTITELIDPGEMFAAKSLSFNKYVLDFINDTGVYGNANPYTDQQLLMSYMTSVYLFAALRRVANLISRIKIVAEIRQGNKYVRAPETTLINRIFERDGAATYSRMYLNYAIYGAAVVYKTKTLNAVIEHANGNMVYDYKDEAVAGLQVLDKPFWELDEDTYNADIKGVFVQRGTKDTDNRNYLHRNEFVYLTDWNPENPNRGRSVATVAIHEAVTNAAIARWSAEYFTRGAMPFVLVAMEEDPAMVTDTDLLKYKRQFEDHWQGVNSSLRSVFIDRNVNVQQVGIPASEVAAGELNESALEGIAAAVGLDRELVVTPSGGSQERHAVLVKRAWDDTVTPMANAMVSAFARDLGLPDDMRLVLDLDHIQELDADREQKVGVELQVYGEGAQTFNEMRTRLNMPSIPQFDGMLKTDEGLMPIEEVAKAAGIPSQRLMEAYANWYERGLTSFNAYRSAIGLNPVQELSDVIYIDGRPMKLEALIRILNAPTDLEIQQEADLIERGLSTLNNARRRLGLEPVEGLDDVIMVDGAAMRIREFLKALDTPSENRMQRNYDAMERGLKSFNSVRSEMGLEPLANMDDVFMLDGQPARLLHILQRLNYPSRDFIDLQTDLLDRGLRSFNEVRTEIGLRPMKEMDDVLVMDGRPIRFSSLITLLNLPGERQFEVERELLELGMQSVNQTLVNLGRPIIPEFEGWYLIDGRLSHINSVIREDKFLDEKIMERITNLWSDNLIKRSVASKYLGIEFPEGEIDGYRTQVENQFQLLHDRQVMLMEHEVEMVKERQVQELEIEMNRKRTLFETHTDRMVSKLEDKFEAEDAATEEAGKSIENSDNDGTDGPDDPNDPNGDGGVNPDNPDRPDHPFRPDGYVRDELHLANVYDEPLVSSVISSRLGGNSVIELVGRNSDSSWVNVYTPESGLGWMQSELIITDKSLDALPVHWSGDVSKGSSSPSSSMWLMPRIGLRGGGFGIDRQNSDMMSSHKSVKSEDKYMDYHTEALNDDGIDDPLLRSPSSFGMSEGDALSLAMDLAEDIRIQKQNEAREEEEKRQVSVMERFDDTMPNAEAITNQSQSDSAYVSLWLGDDETLKGIQKDLKKVMGYNPDYEWVDPEMFHVTLLYSYGIDDENLKNARKLLPPSINPIELGVGPIAAFENNYETVIYIAVRENTALEHLQQRINAAFSAYASPISEYSDPAQYTPHVTMAYVPPGTALPAMDRYDVVSPQSVFIGRDNYEMIHEIPFTGLKALLGDHDEPDGTEHVDLSQRGNREFYVDRLKTIFRNNWQNRLKMWKANGAPPENMPHRIVDAIMQKSKGVKSVSSGVFSAAQKAIEAGLFDEDVVIVGNPLDEYMGKAYQDDADDELRAWEKKALSGYKKHGNTNRGIKFESSQLPEHMSVLIKSMLRKAETEDEIKSVFAKAKESLEE